MLSMHKLAKRSLQFQLKINDNFQFDTIDGEITIVIMRRQIQTQVHCNRFGVIVSALQRCLFLVLNWLTEFSDKNANYSKQKQIVLVLWSFKFIYSMCSIDSGIRILWFRCVLIRMMFQNAQKTIVVIEFKCCRTLTSTILSVLYRDFQRQRH